MRLTPTIMGLVKYLYRAQLLRPHAHEQALSQPARIGLHDFKYMNVGFSLTCLTPPCLIEKPQSRQTVLLYLLQHSVFDIAIFLVLATILLY